MAAVAPEVSVIGATSLGGAAHRPEEASNHASGGRMYIPTGGGGRRCEAGCRGRKTGEDAPRALEPPLPDASRPRRGRTLNGAEIAFLGAPVSLSRYVMLT